MKIFVIVILLSSSALAQVKGSLSGNVEMQGRQVNNSDEAKNEFAQDWDKEEFYLYQGNLNGKLEFKDSKIQSNLFVRHAKSDLLKKKEPIPYLAPGIYSFPKKMVSRDVFKLVHTDTGRSSETEYIITNLSYEWNYDNRFAMGRLNINYGLGEIFNPLNPFNQPTGLTTLNQVSQGADGFNTTFFVNDKHTLNFYILGDKTQDGYDGQIQKTLWIHGEYEFTEKLQFDYVAGEDQNRHKLGSQIKYNFDSSMMFVQVLYQTDFTDDKPSHPLWDAMIGYDQQLNSKWHLRFEGGYQKMNRYMTESSFSERFLPAEYFIAIANQYEIHPLIKITGTVFTDVKDGFTYILNRNTFSIANNIEADIFGSIPMVKSSSNDNPAQKIITTDIGISLRAFF